MNLFVFLICCFFGKEKAFRQKVEKELKVNVHSNYWTNWSIYLAYRKIFYFQLGENSVKSAHTLDRTQKQKEWCNQELSNT